MSSGDETPPLLFVANLKVHLRSSDGVVRAVDGVDLAVAPGETLGLVGESGCGKSMTALALMGLIENASVSRVSGEVRFDGTSLLELSQKQFRALRGNRIAMIFQEPMTSLNPVLTIGFQIAESMRRHLGLSRRAAEAEAVELLARVGIPSPRERAGDYPHRLSGGMRQRAMIAMAIACRPRLLIADEPTTALDVTTQAQILDLLSELKEELGMAVVFITHNLGIVAETTDHTAVMYAGRIVESGRTADLFDAPSHPYTRGLLAAIPTLGSRRHGGRKPLREIPGIVPQLTRELTSCSFAPRCDRRFEQCFHDQPEPVPVGPSHKVRCFAADSDRRPGGPPLGTGAAAPVDSSTMAS